MPTNYWKKDGQPPQKKDKAPKSDVEGHSFRNSDDDTAGHSYKNAEDDTAGHVRNEESDVEGHSFILDTEMNRALARQREKDIQRNLRNETKRPFFRRGR
jgi:hypothetical protein